ncbi:unnamed protein product [Linum tenue]|uniref:Protein kinase domain-containing protein n=1 Tax=Linum tenue TaxID=586396 RepID=A0AAV0IR35_9ROSI|nr:unnamed protein product [Linum tenue]
MDGISIWVLLISTSFFIPSSISESEDVRTSLIQFITNLSNGTFPPSPSSGWNSTSDPCTANWTGVECDKPNSQVKKIILDGFNLTGNFDSASLCSAPALAVLSLNGNLIAGSLPDQIGDCRRLTHLYLNGNRFSGPVPSTVSRLNNLKRFEISNNGFSGQLPDLTRVSGLIAFVADGNQFTGGIPLGFDFTNLERFNVSNNILSGPIPDVDGKFGITSFSGNADLCGPPLPNSCPSSSKRDKNRTRDQILIFSGYILLGLVVVSFIVAKTIRKKNQKETSGSASTSKSTSSEGKSKATTTAGNSRSEMRSEYSITSADSGAAAASFEVLSNPLVKGLKFNDLLKAPAELLGKGKHGSVYKVVLDNGAAIAVKRTKDWGISCEDFSRRIKRIDKVKHPRVLNPLAFYCSDQEKLLVYEYQPNASLFMLLHGAHSGQVLDWGSRLVIASCVAEALAFVHRELQEDGIAHGNLKSTNILFNKELEPCISEYGLMVAEDPDQGTTKSGSQQKPYSSFKVDVYWFGVLLLEMLTGKLVQNNGHDLAKWVHSVVREEWTVEVFDRALTSEGANEERMVNLLQVALKCITPAANERPNMGQIAGLVHAIREEEDRSIIVSEG